MSKWLKMDEKVPAGVYFIEAGGFVKIGHSASPEKRLFGFQVGCPHALVLIGVVPVEGGQAARYRVESQWQKRWEQLWHRGEWYRLTPELTAAIESEAWIPPEPEDFDMAAAVKAVVDRAPLLSPTQLAHLSAIFAPTEES